MLKHFQRIVTIHKEIIILLFFLGSAIAQTNHSLDSLTNKVDSLNIVKKDSLEIKEKQLPVVSKSFYNPENIITKSEFKKEYYNSIGDILSSDITILNSNYDRLGLPDYIHINGNDNISFLIDGIEINSLLSNNFNLTKLQTESFDSVQIFRNSKGFGFSNTLNSSSINFITRTKNHKRPYTRLRILQGPDEEGYIDALFSAKIFKNTNFSFQVTNYSIGLTLDSTYTNDKTSAWKFSSTLQKIINPDTKIITKLIYSDLDFGISGGIDKVYQDTAATDPFGEESSLDSKYLYSSRKLEEKNYFAYAKLLAEIIDTNTTELAIFYKSDYSKYRQDSLVVNDTTKININSNNEYYTGGINFYQMFELSNLAIEIIGNYENSIYKGYESIDESNGSLFSFGGNINWKIINGSLVPSAFYKQTIYNSKNYVGLGGKLKINMSDIFTLTGSLSAVEKPYTYLQKAISNDLSKKGSRIVNTAIDLKLQMKNFSLYSTINFNKEFDKALAVINHDLTETSFIDKYIAKDVTNNNIALKFKYFTGNFLFEVKGNYMLEKANYLPDYKFTSSVSYNNRFFNNNLDLTAFLKFNAIAAQKFYLMDYRYGVPIYQNSFEGNNKYFEHKLEQSYTVDFIISGEFQNRAVITLKVGNLFSKNYYYTPFYPAEGRNFRVSIAWEFID